MSLAELTLPERGKYKCTVTISPHQEHWKEFEKLVKKQYGNKKLSWVVDMLIKYFVENANYDFPLNFDDYPITKITLSVDTNIWDQFSDKVLRLFSKKKIKSSIISTLIKQYLDDHEKEE